MKRAQGRVRASAISGMPRSVGLINWSNRFTVIVTLRFLH